MVNRRSAAAAALIAAITLTAAGCSAGAGGEADGGDATIEWWHIQTAEPTRGIWQELADAYEADNPGVAIEIVVQDSAPFKTALDARLQAGDAPDIFQSWGGGVLANQVAAGAVKDLTEDVAPWIETLKPGPVEAFQVDGQQYGVPYESGLVGFWYNKAIFAEAGIDQPPATWPEFLEAVDALTAAGVVPIALGGGEKWPAMFYWAMLALREGGQEVYAQARETGDFDAEAFVAAGDHIVELLDANAFQEGFLGALYPDATGQASLVANGRAAMELMGSWGAGTQVSVAENGTGLGEDLGWFPFPTVPGGAGTATEGFGGVNGFAAGADASPEAIDFLEYLVSVESQRAIGAGNLLLPVAVGAEDAVTDPALGIVVDASESVTSVQNFLDQDFAPTVATAINDSVQQIFARTLTPEEAARAIAEVARQEG